MADSEPRRPGRPRPPYTVNRDDDLERMLILKGPMTSTDLAKAHNLTMSLTYTALRRLRAQGRVRRTLGDRGEDQWMAVAAPRGE